MVSAQVAELVDALASGASVLWDVGVQVSPWAPLSLIYLPDHFTEFPPSQDKHQGQAAHPLFQDYILPHPCETEFC